MAISPDISEKESAVNEVLKIINRQKKFGPIIDFYERYKEPIKYISTVTTTTAVSMGWVAASLETQNLLFSQFLPNLEYMSKIYMPAIAVSGFGGILIGNEIYDYFRRKKINA